MKHYHIQRFIALCFSSYMVLILPALADTVELYSGQIIDGKVISLDSKTVVIYQKPDKIKVNRNKVKLISFENKEKIAKKPDKIQKTDNKTAKSLKKDPPKKVDKPVQIASGQKQDKPSLRPKVHLKDKLPTKTMNNSEQTVITPDADTKIQTIKPDNKIIAANTETKHVSVRSNNEKVSYKQPVELPSINYITYINGNNSQKMYLGIYSNPVEKDNLTLFLPDKKPQKLSFKLHAQKNGKIPPLYTATSAIFFDKSGNVITKTNPIVVDKDNFIEWFKSLENIAGITGDKQVEIDIPPDAYGVKFVGYRPGSKNNLVGYISQIKLDNDPVSNTNKLK